jgi:hypothetical protein
MTLRKALIAATLAALGAAAAAPAQAWHHGPRVGITFGFGFPYYGGYYPYYPPYAYYPPAVVAAPPVTYIEQSSVAPAQQAAPAASAPDNAWYFCRESNAYYPYVQNCASEWQRVAPSPQGR